MSTLPPNPPSVPPVHPQSAKGVINLTYDGHWVLLDSKITLKVNGADYGAFSFKRPFYIQIPITQQVMRLHAVLSGFRTADIDINTVPNQNYNVLLDYNRAWGSIKFIMR